jgi:hypothetical protein
MRLNRVVAAGFIALGALALAGCGGGASVGTDGGVGVNIVALVPPPPPDFQISALVSGLPVARFRLFPGDESTLFIPVGQTFEFDSTRPVVWTLVVGGNAIPGVNNTIDFAGVTIQQLAITPNRFVASVYAGRPLASSVPIEIFAASPDDPDSFAKIDVVFTN